MPDKKIGVAVMINENTAGGNVGHMLATYVYDWLLGTADREATYAAQVEDGATNYGKMKLARQASVRERANRTSQLTKPLQDYVGRYSNEQLGNIQITPAKYPWSKTRQYRNGFHALHPTRHHPRRNTPGSGRGH